MGSVIKLSKKINNCAIRRETNRDKLETILDSVELSKEDLYHVDNIVNRDNRYLRLVSKKHKYTYKGVDISKPIINQAKKYYGEDEFEVIGKNSDYLQKNKFDIVISRDTVLHQEDPYKFIKSLLQASNNSLILRTMTR